jgi:tRNA dimethylallyltransferase
VPLGVPDDTFCQTSVSHPKYVAVVAAHARTSTATTSNNFGRGTLAAVSIPASEPRVVVAVVGATASGKSGLALDLTESLGGEIVNTDSMQVYRGMDVGTAKLPLAERRGIAHHLLDVLDVTEPATVAQFQAWGREVIDDCHQRGVTPVLVGGSALYTRGILDEFEFPGTDPDIRARLEEELAQVGAEQMYARLIVVDPAAAKQMLPQNGRRVVRALEVIEITGQPWTPSLPEPRYHYDGAVQIGVDIDRATLDLRIEQRVQQMWDGGFVEEVRGLAEHGLREGRTAYRALGYQQIMAFLDGEITLDEAKEQTVNRTRRFARRQDGWFRKDPRITWVAYDDPERVTKALDAIRRVR